MADEHPHELIIVRRHEEEEHAAHSSAWKVAHADFMTAMMAFFLIMWLINVTDEEVRKGISQYFNPIHLSQGSTDLKGLNPPDPANADKAGKRGPNDPVPVARPVNPMQLTAGAGEAEPDAAATPEKGKTNAKAQVETKGEARTAAAVAAVAVAAVAGTARAPALAPTSGAFQDPYAALAKLQAELTKPALPSPDVVVGDARPIGTAGGAASRDPFDPIYWQLTQLPPAKTAAPGEPGSVADVPNGSAPDARAPSTEPGPASDAASPAQAAVDAPPPAGSGASQPAPLTAPAPTPMTADGPLASEVSDESAAAAEAISERIGKSVQSLLAGAAPELTVKATSEGALMRLTDDAAYSMFPVGSASPDAKVVALLAKIAEALATQPGKVIVRGYTDGRPFHTADNDNWRLSAARAHAAYDLLVRGGLKESRVVAIEGHADRDLLNPADPYAAENRRIEILLKVDD
jgi:chemotaxis protein MotB